MFSDGFPSVAHVYDFSVGVNVRLDEPGRVRWVVIPKGAPVPTVTLVALGLEGSAEPALVSGVTKVVVGGVNSTVWVTTALTAKTAYDMYLFAEVGCLLACFVVGWLEGARTSTVHVRGHGVNVIPLTLVCLDLLVFAWHVFSLSLSLLCTG